MFKKIVILTLSTFLALCPIMSTFSYADTLPGEWIRVTTDQEYIAALKAYSATHGQRTILSSSLTGNGFIGAYVKFNYAMWKSQATILGIDMDQLQQNIQYRLDENGQLQFLYDGSIIQSLNQIISAILQQYGVEDGDTKNIYDGKIYVDTDGIPTYMYIVNSRPYKDSQANNVSWSDLSTYFSQTGDNYRYTYDQLANLFKTNNGTNFYVNDGLNNLTTSNGNLLTKNDNLWVQHTYYYYNHYLGNKGGGAYLEKAHYIKGSYNSSTFEFSGITEVGNPIITYFEGDTSGFPINLCILTHRLSDDKYTLFQMINYNLSASNSSLSGALVDIAKSGAGAIVPAVGKAAAIDVGKMGAEIAADAINNYIEEQEPEDDPIVDPDVQDGQPNFPEPTGHQYPSGNPQFPFVIPSLPDLIPDPDDIIPDIPQNFRIQGLKYKFPFCIPFDLVAVFEFLDTEPKAPEINIQKPFPHLNYDIDIDLSDYDDEMVGIRKFWLILYIFGLLFITPQVIKS